MSRYAFIVGTGRCGSTLVHEVLARHDDVSFLTNLEDRFPRVPAASRLAQRLYRALPPAATTKGRLRLAPSEGYRVLDRRVSPVLSMPARDLTADDVTPWLERRVRSFFEGHAGSGVLVHKFTGWPRARFLHRVLPGARFIHVVRDGRAVAASWLRMPWWRGDQGPERWHFGPLPPAYAQEWEASGRSPVLLAGLAWKLLLDAHDEARKDVPEESWLEVRYEDVVAHPRDTFERMLGFLGLEWDAAFDRQFRRHSFAAGPLDAFRSQLDAESLQLLEASLASHLEARGYRADAPLRVVR